MKMNYSRLFFCLVLLSAFVLPAAHAKLDNRECLGCHGLTALKGGGAATIFIDAAQWHRSVHGRLACDQCHRDITTFPHGQVAEVKCESCHETTRRYAGNFHQMNTTGAALLRTRDGVYVLTDRIAAAPTTPNTVCVSCHAGASTETSTHRDRRCVECHFDATAPHQKLAPVQCNRCHVDEGGNFARTAHGELSEGGDTGAPSCVSCHGRHDILPVSDTASPVHPTRVAATCLACHGNAEFAAQRGIRLQLSSDVYAASVHGRQAPERGLAVAATCVDCHGAHTITSRRDPNSPVGFRKMAQTCGRCHNKEAAEYLASSHGMAADAGAHEVPTCSDCHGEHGILAHTDPRSPTYRLQVAQSLCLGCHDRLVLARKYGLPERLGRTYLDSYHGLATRGRSTTAAVCTDCHGTHLILGETDTGSSINPANRTHTCSRCHGDASERFASSGQIHVSYGDHWMTNLVKWFYRFAISGTLGGMAFWIGLLMLPFMRRRFSPEQALAPRRFVVGEIIQHALLVVSFVTLVVTGFALAFPDSGWVNVLATIGLTERLRGIIHRIAGVIMVASGLYHVWYVIFTRRGRWLLARIFPKLSDLSKVRDHLFFSLGLRKHEPHFEHFAYFEKAEYWALVWGSVVMAVTGLALWFPSQLPRLLVAVCEAVHFYEALLAAGAILVWHCFFVFFDPDIFPLNSSMFSGRPPRGSELAERTEKEPDPSEEKSAE